LDSFLDAVLDDRLVNEDQHFLRLRFGCGKESGAETCGWEHGFSNDGSAHERMVSQLNLLRD
jgi:hypothetical protein